MNIMVVLRRDRMKKYLMIIVLLITAILVTPFMQIPLHSKLLAEGVAFVALGIIYNAVKNEKNTEK